MPSAWRLGLSVLVCLSAACGARAGGTSDDASSERVLVDGTRVTADGNGEDESCEEAAIDSGGDEPSLDQDAPSFDGSGDTLDASSPDADASRLVPCPCR